MNVNFAKQEKIFQDENESQEQEVEQLKQKLENSLPKTLEQTTTNTTVRERIVKLNNILEQVQEDLEQSRKDMNGLGSNFEAIRNDSLDRILFVQNTLLNEKNRIQGDLRKGGQGETNEIEFFSQQLSQLQQDKDKLDQTKDSLELRTQACEADVGLADY